MRLCWGDRTHTDSTEYPLPFALILCLFSRWFEKSPASSTLLRKLSYCFVRDWVNYCDTLRILSRNSIYGSAFLWSTLNSNHFHCPTGPSPTSRQIVCSQCPHEWNLHLHQTVANTKAAATSRRHGGKNNPIIYTRSNTDLLRSSTLKAHKIQSLDLLPHYRSTSSCMS